MKTKSGKINSNKKTKKIKIINQYPINQNIIKNGSIKEDWLKRVENFIRDATWNSNNRYYWIFDKHMKRDSKSKKYGFDKIFYPNNSIMIQFTEIDSKTGRENKAFKIYEDDYLFGLAIYQQKFKIDYIKKITGFDYNSLENKILNSYWDDNLKNKKLLILKANVNQLKFYLSDNTNDRNNNLFHLLNLIVSLREIFDKEIKTKLLIKYWDFSKNQEIIDKSDWEIIRILENTDYINNSKVNIWKKIKTIRDIWTHYYKYIPNVCNTHKVATQENCLCTDEICSCPLKTFILLKIIFWNNDIYFFVMNFTENEKQLKIIKYNFVNIENILKDYLRDVLT